MVSSLVSGKKSLDGMYSKSGIGEIKFGEKEMLKIIDKNNGEIMNILKIW
jgi:predicted small secreted protein